MFLYAGGLTGTHNTIPHRLDFVNYTANRGAVLEDTNWEGGSATWATGFAFKFSDRQYDNRLPLFALLDTDPDWYGDFVGVYYGTQCAVHFSPDHKLRLIRGEWNNPTILHTVPFVLKRGVWHYIELKISISGGSGIFQCKIDGKLISDVTGLVTQNTDNTNADGVRFFHHKGDGQDYRGVYIDDIYINSSGSFLTDITVECLYPNANGANTGWDPLSGSNYQMVDDLTPDGDTTYNTAAVDDIDTYTYTDMTRTAGTVHAVNIQAGLFDDNFEELADRNRAAGVIRQGGVNYVHPTSKLMGTPEAGMTYRVSSFDYTSNPATSARFTIDDLNTNAEFGVKRTA